MLLSHRPDFLIYSLILFPHLFPFIPLTGHETHHHLTAAHRLIRDPQLPGFPVRERRHGRSGEAVRTQIESVEPFSSRYHL